MKTRLKDIADQTGFSINTVSRALRDESDISDATKETIRRVANELEYIPNFNAISVKSGKTNTIAVILPDVRNPHFSIVFRGIEQYFRSFGITPLFMNTSENYEDELQAVRVSIGQNVDGVLLCPTQQGTESVRLLEKSGIPFVLIGRRFDKEPNTDYVVADDFSGGYLATRHFVQEGHRKIACVRVNASISSDRERYAGYQKALQEAGLSEIPLNLPLTSSRASETVSDFLRENRDVTAILSFNDLLALRIIRQIMQLGFSVPKDYSVIGFDNICADYEMPVMLSSISVAKKAMAQAAAELLHAYMTGKKTFPGHEHILLPTALILRETTQSN